MSNTYAKNQLKETVISIYIGLNKKLEEINLDTSDSEIIRQMLLDAKQNPNIKERLFKEIEIHKIVKYSNKIPKGLDAKIYFHPEYAYRYFAENFKDCKLNSKEVQELIDSLEKNFESTDGIPMSALINNSKEEKIKIEINEPWDYLGMYNSNKKIVIEGNAGHYLGYNMSGGKIRVKGSTKKYTGRRMKGGTIIVDGNSHDFLGSDMQGGTIIVKGSTGDFAGIEMKGGNIIICEYAGDFLGTTMYDGNIYVKYYAGKNCGINMKGGKICIERMNKNLVKLL